jgi:PAS domain S-box-containing protein
METGGAQPDEQRGASLAQFILSHRSQILALWEGAVRHLPSARELSKPALLDSVPLLLDAIARVISERSVAPNEVPRDLVEKHAYDRLDTGFDLAQVVAEYSLLRYAIVELWERAHAPFVDRDASLILHLAIDQSISLSVERFTEAQLRAGRALDRIATASLESHDLDDLLRRLLDVVLETMPAVDTAAILLREDGDMLRVRAAVGLEREVELGFSLRIGEGFAGSVAAKRGPILLKSPADDPLMKSQILRERRIRALYGVPLIEGATVIGVAHVGSLTASDFSDEDRRMVGALASRATAGIYQQMLRRDAEHRAAELRAVIDSIPDAIYIADRKGIKMTNQPGLELLGLTDPAQAFLSHAEIGKRIRDAATGHDIGEMETGFARAFEGETTVRELVIVRPDGDERIIRSAVAPIELGGRIEQAVSVTTDITEAKRYERERAELLERAKEAKERAESAEAGQRFLSEATAILSSSLEYAETLERLTALAVPRLADWCAIDLVAPDGKLSTVSLAHVDPSKLDTAKQLAAKYPGRSDAPFGAAAVIRTGRAEMSSNIPDELLVSVAENEEHLGILRDLALASYIVVPISAHDRVLGALSLATTRWSGRLYGPSELAIAEHLGRRAGLAIENARLYRQAQEAVRLREQVLAVVSHDLRNPLGAAQMAAESIKRRARERNDARLVKQAQTIGRSASRMERLIGDLLDMASIHVGKLKIERRPHSADAIVQEAIEPFEAMATGQGIAFNADRDVADLHVECDRERILQVFSNLLGNAFKFCRCGDQVTVRARGDGSAVRFEVADTGPGIAASEKEHLFEAYWSAERHGKRGTGLGLFITRGVVEAHGGKIWVESEPGRGATFFFTLPLAHPA